MGLRFQGSGFGGYGGSQPLPRSLADLHVTSEGLGERRLGLICFGFRV